MATTNIPDYEAMWSQLIEGTPFTIRNSVTSAPITMESEDETREGVCSYCGDEGRMTIRHGVSACKKKKCQKFLREQEGGKGHSTLTAANLRRAVERLENSPF